MTSERRSWSGCPSPSAGNWQARNSIYAMATEDLFLRLYSTSNKKPYIYLFILKFDYSEKRVTCLSISSRLWSYSIKTVFIQNKALKNCCSGFEMKLRIRFVIGVQTIPTERQWTSGKTSKPLSGRFEKTITVKRLLSMRWKTLYCNIPIQGSI